MGSEQNEGTSFPPSEPKLCANGCGFFGSASNMNLCSKCYREIRAREEQAVKAKAAMEKSLSVKRKIEDVIVETFKLFGSTMAIEEQQQPQPDQEQAVPKVIIADQEQAAPKIANRCFICRKNVGFRCRCESTFCSEHRYPEKHDCSFDYKGSGRNAIAKAKPVVKADKVDRF